MGGSKHKRKGTRYENELVHEVENDVGLKAERMWGSNGRTRGLPEEVDLLIEDKLRYQAKRQDEIPDYLIPPEPDVITIVKEQRTGEVYVVFYWGLYIRLLAGCIRGEPYDVAFPERRYLHPTAINKLYKPSPNVLGQVYRQDLGTSIITIRKDHYDVLIAGTFRLAA
jgi:hypothetical protein